MISKQEEIFNELVDERLEKTTDLDEKVNSDDLIYRYKNKNADAKFDEFDNALDIINKIWDRKTDLADVKNNQQKFKSYLGKIKKETNQKNKKYFVQYWNALQSKKKTNFMMIILQWFLRQNIKQKIKQKKQDLNINTKTNASKITNSSCTSESW